MSLLMTNGGSSKRLKVTPPVGVPAVLRTGAPSPALRWLLGPQIQPNGHPTGFEFGEIPSNVFTGLTQARTLYVGRLSHPHWQNTGITGTVNVTNGSSVVQGVGTAFGGGTAYLGSNQPIRIYDAAAGKWRYGIIKNADNATQVFSWSHPDGGGGGFTRNWPGTTQSGLAYEVRNQTTYQNNGTPMYDIYDLYNYYDTTFAWGQAWLHQDNCASDSTWLAEFRQMWLNLGASEKFGDMQYENDLGFSSTPRGAAFKGLTLYAVLDRPDWWPRIVEWVNVNLNAWLERNRVGGPLQNQYWTTRDGGYMLQFATCVAVCHPDAAVRTEFTERAIALCLDPILRETAPTLDVFNTSPRMIRWLNEVNYDRNNDGLYDVTQGDGCSAGNPVSEGYYTGSGVVGGSGAEVSQPFQDSLVIEGLMDVHRMMRYHGLTSDSRYATIETAIVAGVRGWAIGYQSAATMGSENYRTARHIGYWSGRGGSDAAAHYWKADAACGLPHTQAAPRLPAYKFVTPIGAPATFGAADHRFGNAEVDIYEAYSARQNTADGVAALGYVYAITGDVTWRDQFKEIVDSMMRHTRELPWLHAAPGTEGVGDGRGSLWQGNNAGQGDTQKNWNQHYGAGRLLKALGWFQDGLD